MVSYTDDPRCATRVDNFIVEAKDAAAEAAGVGAKKAEGEGAKLAGEAQGKAEELKGKAKGAAEEAKAKLS